MSLLVAKTLSKLSRGLQVWSTKLDIRQITDRNLLPAARRSKFKYSPRNITRDFLPQEKDARLKKLSLPFPWNRTISLLEEALQQEAQSFKRKLWHTSETQPACRVDFTPWKYAYSYRFDIFQPNPPIASCLFNRPYIVCWGSWIQRKRKIHCIELFRYINYTLLFQWYEVCIKSIFILYAKRRTWKKKKTFALYPY